MTRAARPLLLAVFFGSGAAGLIYEVVLQRELTRTFGVTAWSTATVLAAYMAGTAAGAALFGPWIDRVRRPLRVYAALELAIAVCAGLTHPAARLLLEGFARTAHGWTPGSAQVALLRAVLAFVFCLPPTILVGGTLPALARGLSDLFTDRGDSGRGIALLYTANLLGATAGTVAVTYQLLPSLGLSRSLLVGAALNLACALVVAGVEQRLGAPVPRPIAEPQPLERRASRQVLAAAAWSGFVTFSFEVVYTQLLAVVVGTSAYAFGLMLAIFLAGLTLGSLIAHSPRWGASFRTLGGVFAAASVAVAITLPLWDHLPQLFLATQAWATTFARRELVRALVCVLGLLGPALLLGACYPLLLRRGAEQESVGRAVGGVAAANTLGCVLGSLAAGFLFLPVLGTRGSLELLATANCLVAVLCFRGELRWQLGSLAVAAALWAIPAWSIEGLASGTNVYFTLMAWSNDPVIFARESVVGGLTTVAEDSRGIRTLLSNGKFQGSTGGEAPAQYRFAQIPLALAHGMERGLVIGVGTGSTAAALAASPIREVEVAELSEDIVEAADTFFRPLNFGVLASPRINLQLADGRNLLLLSDRRYDVITLEITSIWIAGEADLYNREFYRLAADHLAEHGLLQQWVQLHHMSRRDLAVILQSARMELPHVALFFGGSQGELLASREPLEVDYAQAVRISEKSHRPALDGLPGGDLLVVTGEVLLDEAGVDRFIAEEARQAGLSPEELVSTDDNLWLEYDTPRGNVLSMVPMLEELRTLGESALPVIHADGPGAAEHLAGARLVARALHAPRAARLALAEQGVSHLEAAVAQGAPAGALLGDLKKLIAFEQRGR